jgi:hypothetical protein
MSVPPPYPQYYQPMTMPPVQAKPPVIVWDVVVTILIWCINATIFGVAAFVSIFFLSFIDYCPPESCSVEGAFGGVGLGALLAVVVAFAGLVIGIIRMVRRRVAWWIATVALVLSCACCGLGLVLGMSAVGYFSGS